MAGTLQGFQVELDTRDPLLRARLAQHAGLARVVYNRLLHEVKANLDQRAAERSYGILDAHLTPALGWSGPALEARWRQLRDDYDWYAEEGLSSRVPKEACRHLTAALKNWAASRTGGRRGRRVGFPKFRSRRATWSFSIDESRCTPVSTRTVRVPGVGVIRSREDMTWLTTRLADRRARVLGARVFARAGRWWVSFKVQVDRTDLDTQRRVTPNAPAAGVDLGITTLAVVQSSDGTTEKIGSLASLVATERKVRRLHRTLARTQEGSNNREKTRRRLAAAHLKAANRRSDYLHKATTALARTKQTIVIEDLNVAGMTKNRRLAKAVSSAAFGEFRRQLEYKTRWYGSTLVVADRWYPSSKTCSSCGNVKADLTLKDRVYECARCGHSEDRDVNAAAICSPSHYH